MLKARKHGRRRGVSSRTKTRRRRELLRGSGPAADIWRRSGRKAETRNDRERGRDQQRRAEEVRHGSGARATGPKVSGRTSCVLSAEEISAARHWPEESEEISRSARPLVPAEGGRGRGTAAGPSACNLATDRPEAVRRVARLPGVKMSNF